jgi:hypothetical protein
MMAKAVLFFSNAYYRSDPNYFKFYLLQEFERAVKSPTIVVLEDVRDEHYLVSARRREFHTSSNFCGNASGNGTSLVA